jgi:hypothetical protein
MTGGEFPQPLDGKTAEERLALARAILDADRRNLYPLSHSAKWALTLFIKAITQRRAIDDMLVREVNRLAREHQQNLIALAYRDR